MWNCELQKYLLKIFLDKNDSVLCITEGFSEEHALETACYKPILSLNSDIDDLFKFKSYLLYLTGSGRDFTQEEFREIVFKARDGKLEYEIESYCNE